MIDNLALITGVVSIVFAVFTIIVLLMLKKNIKDILNKDALVFDRNFEIKKTAITDSLNLIDALYKNGRGLSSNSVFIDKVNKCYNDLLCVVNDVSIADIFRALTLESDENLPSSKVTVYKLLCRKEIGLPIKNSSIKKVVEQEVVEETNEEVEKYAQPEQTQSNVTAEKVVPTQTTQSAIRPAQQSPAVRPTQSKPVAKPTTSETQKK